MLNIADTDSCLHVCMLSRFGYVSFFATLWIIALQALLSIEFSRQEYWSGLPFPSPEDLPDPGIEPVSLMSPDLAGMFLPPVPPILTINCEILQSFQSLP